MKNTKNMSKAILSFICAITISSLASANIATTPKEVQFAAQALEVISANASDSYIEKLHDRFENSLVNGNFEKGILIPIAKMYQKAIKNNQNDLANDLGEVLWTYDNDLPIVLAQATTPAPDEPSAVACCVKEVGVAMVKGAATGAAQGAGLARSSGIPEAAPAAAVAGGIAGGAIGSAIGTLGCVKCIEDAKKERELRAAKEEIEKLQREKAALEKAAAEKAAADRARAEREAIDRAAAEKARADKEAADRAAAEKAKADRMRDKFIIEKEPGTKSFRDSPNLEKWGRIAITDEDGLEIAPVGNTNKAL